MMPQCSSPCVPAEGGEWEEEHGAERGEGGVWERMRGIHFLWNSSENEGGDEEFVEKELYLLLSCWITDSTLLPAPPDSGGAGGGEGGARWLSPC